MKRLLIISYYWPPAGGGGVMRWLKLSKYLSTDSDWLPTVYCPDQANYLVKDPSLVDQVPKNIEFIKVPIWEPNSVLLRLGFKKFLKGVAAGGVGKEKNSPSLVSRFMVWVRSNLFIPDARAFWIKPSVKRLRKELIKGEFDAIVSTGPPHSMHLIALALKKEFDIPWIADFRDPWTFIDFFEDLNLSEKSRKKHERLEQEVLDSADKVVTVSHSWAEKFRMKTKTEVRVIRNGFDPADFDAIQVPKDSEKFRLCHIGSLNKDRSAPIFWEALQELCKLNLEFKSKLKVEIIGTVSHDLIEDLQSKGLEDLVEIVSHLPHAEVLRRLKAASISLLFINNTSNQGGIIPGKLYEYLAIGNPIYCVGNLAGDSAKIIEESQAGQIVEFEDKQSMIELLEDYYAAFNKGSLSEAKAVGIEKYSRKSQAVEYSRLLDEIIEGKK